MYARDFKLIIPVFDDLRIRQISYILVKFEDSANVTAEPTDDEKARMKAVDDALASGTFADAAIAHSEDDSSAPDGGNLGIIDKNASSLDAAFLEASLALKEGETSDWIRSENFGYFASIMSDEDSDFVRFHVRVGINQKFYLWLMQFGSGVELAAPAKERAEYLDEVRKMLGAYPEFEKEEKTD